MNAVLTSPEASPDSSGTTSLMAGEEHRVEGHAGAAAEQDHARKDVDEEAPVDGSASNSTSPTAASEEAGRERRPDAEAHHELGRETDRDAPMIRFAGRKARPTSSGL